MARSTRISRKRPCSSAITSPRRARHRRGARAGWRYQRIIAFTPLLNTVSGPMILWLSVPKEVVTAPAQRELMDFAVHRPAMMLLLVMALVYLGRRTAAGAAAAEAVPGRGPLRQRRLHRPHRTSLPRATISAGWPRPSTPWPNPSRPASRSWPAPTAPCACSPPATGRWCSARPNRNCWTTMCRAIVEAGDYRLAWVGYAGRRQARATGGVLGAPEGFLRRPEHHLGRNRIGPGTDRHGDPPRHPRRREQHS